MQITAEPFEVAARPLTLAVGAIAIEHCRMARPGIGARVHRVSPEPRQAGLAGARRQGADRRIVGPQHWLRHDVLADQPGEGEQPPGDMAHPLGHDGAIDVDALARQDARLPVERKPIAVFRDGDVGQQPWPGAAFLDRQLWRRRLEHGLAEPTGVFGPDMADHLQPDRDLLQHLGRGLAELDQAGRIADAAAAGDLWFVHHHLARQMRRQRLAAGGFPPRLGLGE